MNVKLLRRIQKAISKEPEKYDQDAWCGSECCLAGHAVILSGHAEISNDSCEGVMVRLSYGKEVHIQDFAAEELELTEDQSCKLFDVWPREFREAYDGALTDKGRARVAVRRIDHFIKTKGAE